MFDKFVLFVGHLHPLVVHLPIGFWVALAIGECCQWRRPGWRLSAGNWLLLLLAVGATGLAILCGLGLTESEYDEELYDRHYWSGIALGLVGLAAIACRRWWPKGYPVALVGALAVMVFGSHAGGSMTHGRHHLTKMWGEGEAERERPRPVLPHPDEGNGPIRFADHVLPILRDRCIDCHGADKKKGDLRLDSARAIRDTAGEHVIVPGDPLGSDLYFLVSLPHYDEDLMPPEGEGEPLGEAELDLIRRWIEEGADFGDGSHGGKHEGEGDAAAAGDLGPAWARHLTAALLATDEAVDFTADVVPILADRCYRCHGADKQKGGLRLDTVDHLLAGKVVFAGDPEGSALSRLIALPAGHEDLMPAEGDPLTHEQIATIRTWILQGARFDDGRAAPPPIGAADTAVGAHDLDVAGADLDPPPEAALAALREAGATVRPLNEAGSLIEVDASHAEAWDRRSWDRLRALAPHLAWCDLGGLEVADADLRHLAGARRLRRLVLDRTPVGDDGLAHLTGLDDLRALNLIGTAVTDRGLPHLRRMQGLERVHLWRSRVTARGIEGLRSARENLKIVWEPAEE